MTWEIAFVFALLVAGLVSFILEKISSDLTAILLFCALLLVSMLPFTETLPETTDLLRVFANPAPITIAAMFILSAGLDRCGAIDLMANALESLAGLGYRRFLLIMMLTVAVVSAFINNTPVVVVMMPVILGLSRKLNVPASKMLIPLSYASILGGTCTLVGTSTNILASIVLRDTGLDELGMFELSSVGLPLVIVGILYILVFGKYLLPDRETLTAILSEEERKEYFTEAYIKADSNLVGQNVKESGLLRGGVRVVEIIRQGVAMQGELKKIDLEAGDRLVLACRPSGLAHARSFKGFDLQSESGLNLEQIAAHEGAIVEGVIGPKSTIVGRTISEINFRQRYRMIVLAMHRRSENVRDKIDTLPLQFGDTLLMMGTDKAIEDLRGSDDVLLLDRARTASTSSRKKMPIVIAIVLAIITAASLNPANLVAAAMIGAAALFVTGCLEPKDGYKSIEWSILFMIFGMLGLGLAMETTGAAALIANGMVSGVKAVIPVAYQPFALLVGIYICTNVLTELLSNNATVVLMAPIAIGLGEVLGIDSRGFIIAVCVASSASFSSPIGYQTNTYVYGVGGYRFADFFKVGIPLNLLCLVVAVAIIPQVWPMQ